MVEGELTDIGDRGPIARSSQAVNTDDIRAADIPCDQCDERVGNAIHERDVHRAAEAESRKDRGDRQPRCGRERLTGARVVVWISGRWGPDAP
jgi:hypothetical protein